MSQSSLFVVACYITFFFISLFINHFCSHKFPAFVRPSTPVEKVLLSVLITFSAPIAFVFTLLLILLILSFYIFLNKIMGIEMLLTFFACVVGIIALSSRFAVRVTDSTKIRIATLTLSSGIAYISLNSIEKLLKIGINAGDTLNQFFVFSLAIATLMFILLIIFFGAQWSWSRFQRLVLRTKP